MQGPVVRKESESPPKYKTMDGSPYLRPHDGRAEQLGRSSFSSIRENDSDLVQTFSRSKVSSYTYDGESAVEEDSSPKEHTMVEVQFRRPVTQPFSKLHGYWAPAESFQGWKGIDVRGKLASKSFGDLQILNLGFTKQKTAPPPRRRGTRAPGDAPIERLPIELLSSIISLLVLDIPPGGIAKRNVDLMSLLLTSKTLHVATLDTLYSRITIPHSRIFHKFLTHISDHQSLGTVVRRLDFCHFNPAQLFSTASERQQARNLTSDKLLHCLELTPYLQEFLAQEYIDDELDPRVLQKLFFGLPRLQALDLCGCSSASFKSAISALMGTEWPSELSIRRLSMHKCLGLPSAFFERLLPLLKHATHLDLAGTRVTDDALVSIPKTAKITHLNLAKCKELTANGVIRFLATHPSVKSLTFLSLATDARSHQLLDVEDVSMLLQVLPKTLRSLSLKGSKMDASHTELLVPLSQHLEELALGRYITLPDINGLFSAMPDADGDAPMGDEPQLTLKYLDLSDLWADELDLSYLFGNESALLTESSQPLEVIEIAEDGCRRLTKSPGVLRNSGWRMTECGARTWLVREPVPGNAKKDDGRRWWKMGAESWGMRKIPVARAEVGGMYGSFMFARKL